MPYFLLLPLYTLFFVGLIVAGGVLMLVPKLRPFAVYVFGAVLGSLPGFLLANMVLALVTILIVDLPVPKPAQTVQGLFVAAMVFIGPFIVSGVGVLLGSLAGIALVRRRKSFRAV